jgi:Ca2+-binding EF-hand superfamily protein
LFANITNLKTTSPAELSKIEFVLGMLELMGKVRRSDVVLASTMFDRLDGNGDGLIDCEEMARAMERFQQDQGSLTTSNDDFAY